MFRAILSADLSELELIGHRLANADKRAAALLCLDFVFFNPPAIQVMKAHEVAAILVSFNVYASLLNDLATLDDPCGKPAIQKLFGFQPSTENAVLLHSDRYLHLWLMRTRAQPESATDEAVLVDHLELTQALRTSLRSRLRESVLKENEVARRARAFVPCLGLAVHGVCPQAECYRDHVKASDMTPELYNTRIRLPLLQIRIYQTLHAIDIPERWKEKRYFA